jgi:L-asparaginase
MAVDGLLRRTGAFTRVSVNVKTTAGELVPAAIPRVIFVKGDHWYDDSGQPDPSTERGIAASIDMLQESYPLAGIVAEGLAPYATLRRPQLEAVRWHVAVAARASISIETAGSAVQKCV